ncbi:Polyubiquitin (Fragment) [Seminavis robusta]|uniref:Polyubiquitin n=1 Tax=Seminavis robusta TaxID=568900 RepID=A0A9N8HD34_9STRA
MRLYYILDEGLPLNCQTGVGLDKVSSLQNAIKFLVKSKEVMAAKVEEIQVFPLGVTIKNFREHTPLKPDDPLPKGSTTKNAIFCHVERDYQDLTAERRRLLSNPVPSPAPSPKAKRKSVQNILTVTVRPKDGKQFKSKLFPKHTIANLKKQFEGPSKVPADNQNLFLDGTALSDPDKTAEDYGIKNGDIIDLEPKTIQVHVQTPDGKRIPVTMDTSDKIQFIKEEVAPETGIDVPEQVLKFNGKELSNEETADEAGLENGSVLHLMPNTIQVHVRTPDGTTIPVTMKPTDNIEFIKEKVAPETGIEVPQQVLKFQGRELPNDKTAKAMGLQDGDIIDLEPKTIQVLVRTPDGTKIPVTMKPTDNIEFIKEKVAPETGIEVPQQVLKFKEKNSPITRLQMPWGYRMEISLTWSPRQSKSMSEHRMEIKFRLQ